MQSVFKFPISDTCMFFSNQDPVYNISYFKVKNKAMSYGLKDDEVGETRELKQIKEKKKTT